MARFAEPEKIAEIEAKGRGELAAVTHDGFNGYTPSLARATSPYQPGDIVWVDIGPTMNDHRDVRRALVAGLAPEWSDYSFEYVNHAYGFIERKSGGWGRMYRTLHRGDITRGYELKGA